MPLLHTPRLALVETPPAVARRRLEGGGFVADVDLGDGPEPVRFPPEWPGDALVLFPALADSAGASSWERTLVERATRTAVGQMGCKGAPAAGGAEIGYGLNPSAWRRGLGTEAVAAFARWLLGLPEVAVVRAECRTDNAGSIRVLEKAGFGRAGGREDPDDGPLILWERRASRAVY